MIVPIIFSLAPNTRDLMYEWVFLKGLTFARQNNSAVIAQEQYFNSDDKILKYFPHCYKDQETADRMGYELPTYEAFKNTLSFQIPKQIERAFLAKFPSETDAYLATAKSDWPEMETFLMQSLQAAAQQKGDKVEAILTLFDYQFLNNVAQKLEIPIIHFEIGSFREPMYRQTAYIDLKGLHGNSSLEAQLKQFKQREETVPILTKSEILAMFLCSDKLRYAVPEQYEIPKYECGIALGYSTLLTLSSHNKVSSIEMITRAQRIFDDNQFCVRYHPGDPLHAEANVLTEQEGSVADFILKCKRVLCASSNVGYEAMLYNRSAYDVGWSQFGCIVNHSLEELDDKIASDEELSYVAFGYHAPYELLMDVDYLRYRLSNPSVTDVYEYHLNYYLNCLSIDRSILELPHDERLWAILNTRGFKIDSVQGKDFSNTNLWMQCDRNAKQEIEIVRLKEKILKQQKEIELLLAKKQEELELLKRNFAIQMDSAVSAREATVMEREQEIVRLNKSLQEVLNSTSYKITKPLRTILGLMRKKN